ncbi:MAG: rod shape-determining protein RodA [Desulfobacterales bacterium]|nr:rod shape-determining protein RodA [Desulfobacterales bacterium]MCP4162383.1 rod shape-determining protein RodA [Deltaproteobacteria bacterium]
MFDKRIYENIDWGLIGLTLLLCFTGLIVLYSAVHAGSSTSHQVFFKKQLIWLACGLCCMIIVSLISYKNLEKWGIWIYIFCICLLIAVYFFGKKAGGSQRWLELGPVTVQPSEIVKVAVIIILARYFSKKVTRQGFVLKTLMTPFILVMIPFLLIAKQPDLGTSMLILLISVFMTLFVKIARRTFIYMTVSGAAFIPFVWMFLLQDYQKQRILTFLSPDSDTRGAGYHIFQSKIAIGSGMITGKGYLEGTQNALSFLPEQHTDFILTVLAEEWGFIGSSFLLVVYLAFMVWGLNIAAGCRDSFGTILAVGIVSMLFCQVFINVGMIMGLMPVVGVPLPLVSYGGSSVLTSMIGIGILMSISIRRQFSND